MIEMIEMFEIRSPKKPQLLQSIRPRQPKREKSKWFDMSIFEWLPQRVAVTSWIDLDV